MKHYKNILTIDIKQELENNNNKSSLKIPREDQAIAQKSLSKFFFEDNKRSGILVLPTGAGKTYTATYWLLKNVVSKNIKIIWLADQGYLLEQAREDFRENILEVDKNKRQQVNIRVVSGSDKHGNPNQIELSDDVLFITAQTAISNWDTDLETKFKKFVNLHSKENNLFIVYDEAHHTPAYGRRNLLIGGSEGKIGILEKYPNVNLLGLTATPTYTNKNQRGWLWEIFKGGIIYEISKKYLQDKKVLALPNFIQEKTNFNLVLSDSDIEKVLFKHQEIPQHIIDELAKNEERNDFIAEYYCKNIDKLKKTIIFLDRWYQCRTVENYINKKAGKTIAASVFSYVDSNKSIEYINNRTANQNEINIEKFRNGELQVIINVKMLTEGFNVPDVNSVIITRDTNSSILFEQMIGRALRGEKAGGGLNKDKANIVMFSDNWNRHIHFASNKFNGGKDENERKERGFRPLELISIDLIDKIEMEYQKGNFNLSIYDLMPNGWYVVNYFDCFVEENEDLEIQKTIENFIENVIVLENEEQIFNLFISNYSDKYKNVVWENEELDFETAQNLINTYLIENNFENNNAIISKLIQVARHLGQNNLEPEYFTFEQKNEININNYVLKIRDENIGRDETELYLENEYYSSNNPFLKIIFPTYEDFYRGYELEDNVYRRRKKGAVSISEASQKIKVQRLATEEIRKLVFSRDENKCLCCGKTNNLQIDHIISFKEQEPENDNPELFQTLCGVCNREKSSNSSNFRVLNYSDNKMSLKNVQGTNHEDTNYYFTRLINCYYKTNAVQKDTVYTINNGNSIWKAKIKRGTDPAENIMKQKTELINLIQENGYRLKDILIENN